jgi:chromosome segregation ATPase
MNEQEVKAVIEQTVNTMAELNSKLEECQKDCDAKIAEANENAEAAIAEKNEVVASVEEIKTALEQVRAEYKELDEKYNELWEEKKQLEKALGEAKAKERVAALNTALAEFSEVEREYAKDEINAFNENPMEGEIDAIVMKINAGIGAAFKADEVAKAAEQNSVDNGDIFEEMHTSKEVADENIF